MAAAAPVAQGEETLSVTVSVSWAIKPEQSARSARLEASSTLRDVA